MEVRKIEMSIPMTNGDKFTKLYDINTSLSVLIDDFYKEKDAILKTMAEDPETKEIVVLDPEMKIKDLATLKKIKFSYVPNKRKDSEDNQEEDNENNKEEEEEQYYEENKGININKEINQVEINQHEQDEPEQKQEENCNNYIHEEYNNKQEVPHSTKKNDKDIIQERETHSISPAPNVECENKIFNKKIETEEFKENSPKNDEINTEAVKTPVQIVLNHDNKIKVTDYNISENRNIQPKLQNVEQNAFSKTIPNIKNIIIPSTKYKGYNDSPEENENNLNLNLNKNELGNVEPFNQDLNIINNIGNIQENEINNIINNEYVEPLPITDQLLNNQIISSTSNSLPILNNDFVGTVNDRIDSSVQNINDINSIPLTLEGTSSILPNEYGTTLPLDGIEQTLNCGIQNLGNINYTNLPTYENIATNNDIGVSINDIGVPIHNEGTFVMENSNTIVGNSFNDIVLPSPSIITQPISTDIPLNSDINIIPKETSTFSDMGVTNNLTPINNVNGINLCGTENIISDLIPTIPIENQFQPIGDTQFSTTQVYHDLNNNYGLI